MHLTLKFGRIASPPSFGLQPTFLPRYQSPLEDRIVSVGSKGPGRDTEGGLGYAELSQGEFRVCRLGPTPEVGIAENSYPFATKTSESTLSWSS